MIRGLLIFWGLFSYWEICQAQKDESRQDLDSDSSVIELGEVIVTATRTQRQLSSLPMPSQIITQEEIQQTNTIRLEALLNELTGVVTVPDFGGGEGIQMQGLDAEYTLILVDGVPLIGRQAGTLDVNRITIGNIQQIEIIKGASSSLYGTEALGGVVNIITKKPENGIHGHLNYRLSSFNTHDLNLNLTYQKEKLGLQLFGNRNSSDGYDLIPDDELKTVNPFYNYTLQSKISYQISTKTDVLLSGRYYYQNQDNIASSTIKGESQLDEWNFQTKVNHQWNPKWSSYLDVYTTSYQASDFLKDINNQFVSNSEFNQLLFLPEFRTTYSIDNHNVIFGIGWRHETLERSNFVQNPVFDSQYFYAQYDGHFANKLNLIAGLRFDKHSEYASQWSPKLALRYEIHRNLAFRGSVGYGFKAPDFRQLYFDFTNSTAGYTVLGYNAVEKRLPEFEAEGALLRNVIPMSELSKPLSPESSINWNIGFQYEPTSRFSIEGNFFRNDIRNLIDIRVIANKTNGQNVFSYYNINRVYTTGFEVNINWKPNQNLTLKGGYQLLYAKDKKAKEAFENGEIFARNSETLQSFQLESKDYFGLFNRSRHMFNVKVFYHVPQWNWNTNLRTTYRSQFGLFDANGNTYLDQYDSFVADYFIIDWAMTKTFHDKIEVGLGIDNILNFTDEINISNIAGRIFYGKVNLKF